MNTRLAETLRAGNVGDKLSGTGLVGCLPSKGDLPAAGCEDAAARLMQTTLPAVPSGVRLYAGLSLPGYTPALFATVRPALLAALKKATSQEAVTATAGSPTKQGLVAATTINFYGRGAKKSAVELGAGLRKAVPSWSGLEPFQAAVIGAVKVDVGLPKPAWMPAAAERRVINATASLEVSQPDAGRVSLTPSRRATFLAGLKNALNGRPARTEVLPAKLHSPDGL